jgi:hypothetical protein
MKNIHLISLFVLALTTHCNAQKTMKQSKKYFDQFLKWRLAGIKEKMVSIRPTQLDMKDLARMAEDDNIKFSKKDSLEIKPQLEINNNYRYDSTLFPAKTFIKKIEYGYFYIKISNPIFFDNGKKLWVYIEHHCPDTCGEGRIEVYELNNGEFKLLFETVTWVS